MQKCLDIKRWNLQSNNLVFKLKPVYISNNKIYQLYRQKNVIPEAWLMNFIKHQTKLSQPPAGPNQLNHPPPRMC